jgi:hypothetical protein
MISDSFLKMTSGFYSSFEGVLYQVMSADY